MDGPAASARRRHEEVALKKQGLQSVSAILLVHEDEYEQLSSRLERLKGTVVEPSKPKAASHLIVDTSVEDATAQARSLLRKVSIACAVVSVKWLHMCFQSGLQESEVDYALALDEKTQELSPAKPSPSKPKPMNLSSIPLSGGTRRRKSSTSSPSISSSTDRCESILGSRAVPSHFQRSIANN